ncbi:MAG TPA: tRNA (guanosine(37)-N1)-methyltransferase TrmD, partial [Caldisericia bacterium]|nr:tRNA (guanosine(37)-N1)-methyltransferase TrmD [Caldisericia bacterium]
MNTRLQYVTTFPGILDAYFGYSLPGRAVQKGLISYQTINIRDFTQDLHRTTDDTPFGGGPGMVMKLEPIVKAIQQHRTPETLVILPTPKGQLLTQEVVHHISSFKDIMFLCGHYEGIDDRVFQYVDMPISIGDYVLSGGELAAAVISDSIIRLIPGAISDETSALTDSFQDNLLAPPVYTRPADYKGLKVP